jgi:phage shock protein A
MFNSSAQLSRELNDKEWQLSCVRSKRDRLIVLINEHRSKMNDISRYRQSIGTNQRTSIRGDDGMADYLLSQQRTLEQEKSRFSREVDECDREEARLEVLIRVLERNLNDLTAELNNNNDREPSRYRR